MRQVVLDLGLLRPRQVDQRVDVVAHDGGLGRHRRHQLELLQLGVGLLARLLGHLGGLDLLLELLDVGALFAVAELLLDRLDLLVQVVLALALLHLALDAAADALFDLQDVDLVLELLEQLLQPLVDVDQVEHRLLVLELERQVRGDRVGQAAGIVDAGDRGQDLGRDLLVQLDVLVELLRHGAAQRLDLAASASVSRRHRRRPRRRSARRCRRCCACRRAATPSTSTFTVPSGSFSICRMRRDAADLEHVVGLSARPCRRPSARPA